MKVIFSIALVSALSVVKAWESAAQTPYYTVRTVTSDGNAVYTNSNNGIVYLSFYPQYGPFLTHAEIDNANPPNSATCVARDNMGNQVRAFGGPNFGNVNAVDFVPADGKQIFSLSCGPA